MKQMGDVSRMGVEVGGEVGKSYRRTCHRYVSNKINLCTSLKENKHLIATGEKWMASCSTFLGLLTWVWTFLHFPYSLLWIAFSCPLSFFFQWSVLLLIHVWFIHSKGLVLPHKFFLRWGMSFNLDHCVFWHTNVYNFYLVESIRFPLHYHT